MIKLAILYASVLLLLLLLAFRSPSAPVPHGADASSYYFPTKQGTRWVYRTEVQGNEAEVAEVICSSRHEDRSFIVSIGIDNGESITPYRTLKITRDGIYLVSHCGRECDRPICILNSIAKVGYYWELPPPGLLSGPNRKCTIHEEEFVCVPAGKFNCKRVTTEIGLGTIKPETIDTWFARGIGRVKSIAVSGTKTTTEILTKFSAGND